MSRVQRDTLAYISIIVFCIVLLAWAIPKYTPAYPGYGASPALVPIVSVSVIMAMAVLALVRNAIATFGGIALPPEESDYPDDAQSGGFTQIGKVNLLHLLNIVVPSVLLVVGFEYIGYVPTALLFMLLIQYAVGSRAILQPIIISIAAVAFMYVAMRYGFGIPVPGVPIPDLSIFSTFLGI